MTAEQKVRFLTSQAELIERELGTNSSSFHSFNNNIILQLHSHKKTALSKGESRKALLKRNRKKTHVPLETFLLDSQSSCKSYLYSEGTERDEKPYNYLLKG